MGVSRESLRERQEPGSPKCEQEGPGGGAIPWSGAAQASLRRATALTQLWESQAPFCYICAWVRALFSLDSYSGPPPFSCHCPPGCGPGSRTAHGYDW